LEQRPIFVDLRERNKQLLSDLAEVRAKYERQEDTVNKLLQQRQQDHEQMEVTLTLACSRLTLGGKKQHRRKRQGGKLSSRVSCERP